jgi:cytochrome c oxidase subunit 1
MWTVPILFLVLVLLGLSMRANQAGIIDTDPALFYSAMTLHGLGMAGLAFVSGLVAVTWLLAGDVRISLPVAWSMYGLTVLGVVGLVIACLLGKFGPGWYVLYPLPFLANIWPDWSVGLAVLSLIVLGVAWLVGQVDLYRALLARYGLWNMLGWQYLAGGRGNRTEIAPIVLITAAGCLIPGILTTLDGAVLLVLYLIKWISPALGFDPLLLKNMVFLWGHTLVNITMYLGLAMVYELLPRYCGRRWGTNAVVVVAWNAVLALVLLAFFHHLYMDYVQPLPLQYIGQVASYLSAVPATVVTVFGVIGQVYGSAMRWRFVPLALYLGIVGWVIGGFAAVVDSTITVNTVFHNTLWVPAHFHTYFLAGYFLMLWGFLYDFSGATRDRLATAGLWLLVAGAYGFLFLFYLGGTFGVPRRFAVYNGIPIDSLAAFSAHAAMIAFGFVVLLIIGLLLMFGVVYAALAEGPSAGRDAAAGG